MEITIKQHCELHQSDCGPDAMLVCPEGDIYRWGTRIGKSRCYVAQLVRGRHCGYSQYAILDTYEATVLYSALYSSGFDGYSASVNRALHIAKADRHLHQDLLIFDRIEILPRYRGKGYGHQAMGLLMEGLSLGCSLAALKAFPLQFEYGIAEKAKSACNRMAVMVAAFATG